MILKIKLTYLCIIIYMVELISCLISVNDTENNVTVAKYYDKQSRFGGRFKEDAVAYLFESYPILACNKSIRPPTIHLLNNTIAFVVLIKRGICTFEHKIRTAQNSGYHGVIIYNNESEDYFHIPGSAHASDIHIPSVMVGLTSGRLLSQYTFTLPRQQYIVIFNSDFDFNPSLYIIVFLGFVSLGFLIIGLGFAIKLCRDYIKRRSNRLKKCHLKNIPVKKFIKGEDTFETCAICLDDFEDGDKLRILPCNHAYHMKCIDPWLLKQKRNCPVCKSRIKIPGRDEESDDNSSIAAQSDTVNTNINEHTPLINPSDCGPSQSYLSSNEITVNCIPESMKSTPPNCYENPCIDGEDGPTEQQHSIDVIVIGVAAPSMPSAASDCDSNPKI